MTKVLCVLILAFFSGPSFSNSCTDQLNEHLKTDLNLSYKEFDQTMDSGMRVLASQGCHSEAADLIEAYIDHNNAKQSSLRWHIAQLRATAGENSEAITSAKLVLIENEDFSKRKLRWNDYVLATIAFLEGDKTTLMIHRDNVALARDEHFGNELNLKLLNGLVIHFGKSYEYATSNL